MVDVMSSSVYRFIDIRNVYPEGSCLIVESGGSVVSSPNYHQITDQVRNRGRALMNFCVLIGRVNLWGKDASDQRRRHKVHKQSKNCQDVQGAI